MGLSQRPNDLVPITNVSKWTRVSILLFTVCVVITVLEESNVINEVVPQGAMGWLCTHTGWSI